MLHEESLKDPLQHAGLALVSTHSIHDHVRLHTVAYNRRLVSESHHFCNTIHCVLVFTVSCLFNSSVNFNLLAMSRTNEWICETVCTILRTCKCSVLSYSDASLLGLDSGAFRRCENEQEQKITCITEQAVFSLKRLSVRDENTQLYIGLHRNKVAKGYWSQFVFVIHATNLNVFVLILTGDMADNCMQRFAWKMYPQLQCKTLLEIRKHMLCEDCILDDWSIDL